MREQKDSNFNFIITMKMPTDDYAFFLHEMSPGAQPEGLFYVIAGG